ncbi:hypothetical protein PO909_011096 [Leuciscus waleckii]
MSRQQDEQGVVLTAYTSNTEAVLRAKEEQTEFLGARRRTIKCSSNHWIRSECSDRMSSACQHMYFHTSPHLLAQTSRSSVCFRVRCTGVFLVQQLRAQLPRGPVRPEHSGLRRSVKVDLHGPDASAFGCSSDPALTPELLEPFPWRRQQ